MKNNESDEKEPLTLENLHEFIQSLPPEQFEKARKEYRKKIAESREFWKDRENGKR